MSAVHEVNLSGGEADQQASGVDHPAEDDQPFRRGAFGDCLVDGKDFVTR